MKIIEDGRALAAEFEGNRRQMIRSGRRDDASNGGVSSVEYEVPLLFEKSCSLLRASFDKDDAFGVQNRGNKLHQPFGGAFAHFAWLDDNAVTSSNRSNER